MNNHPSHSVDLLEWESLFDESIELLPNQIDRAVQYSQQIPTVKRQWPVYLQMLAFSGFIQWLEEWSPELNVSHTHCSILKPEYANLLEAVCNLQVGSFSLCLVAVGNLADTVVNLPKAIVDLPQFTPHIYVLLVVQEEEMLVQVCGYLRHDQLLQQQQLAPLSAASNWNYHVPLNWFNSDSNALLLDLNCLDPAAISLPASPFQTTLPNSFQLKLTTLLPKLQSPAYSLEQDLTWQEWATLLTSPDLAEWLYQTQLSEANEQQEIEQQNTSLSGSLSVAQLFSQQTVNAGLWLRDQLDAVAQELSWVLMPPFNASTAPAMRSVVEELETVASTLRNQGFTIPQEARGAYRDLRWDNVVLRLYAVVWALSSIDNESEWSLLLVLGTQSGTRVPGGVRLRVQDEMQLLEERTATEDAQSYLCIQVAGSWTEQFWVKVELSNGATVTIPFAFNPSGL